VVREDIKRLFTAAVRSIKQFGYKLHLKVLRSSADLQLYDSEFQTEAALTPGAHDTSEAVNKVTCSNKTCFSS